MTPLELWALVVGFVMSTKLHIILGLIVIDVVLAVSVALRTQTFQFKKLADFLGTMIIPYVLAYLVLHVVVGAIAELTSILGQGLDTVIFLVIVASLVAAIWENFKALGINVPAPSNNDNPVVK